MFTAPWLRLHPSRVQALHASLYAWSTAVKAFQPVRCVCLWFHLDSVYGIAGARGVAGTHALFCWVWLAPSESSVWYCWCDSMIGALQGFSQNLAPLIFLKCVAATCCAPSLQRQRLGDGRDPRGNSNNPIRTGKGKSKASEDDRVLSYLLGPPLDKALTALASAEAKASSTQVAKHAGSTARLK
eukprot:scaffold232490_cov17-Tisochrysis_lutea.AAC.1